MTARQAMVAGLDATRRAKWMVLIFFGCNLLLAAAAAGPMHSAIADHLGNSKYGQELARGFSAAWLTEFEIAYEGFLKAFSLSMVYMGIVFLALSTVLSAGAFEVFAQGEGAGLHAFGRGIGKYFVRFAIMALAASILYFAAFWLLDTLAARGIDYLFRHSVYERWRFDLHWLRRLLLFASVFTINAMVEYAKADMVMHEHSSAMGALGHAAGFVVAHYRRVMAIYLGLGALGLASILLYSVFARYFPQHNVPTVLAWFVVAQVLLALRWYFRLASWGAAVYYYGSHEMRHRLQPEPSATPVSVS